MRIFVLTVMAALMVQGTFFLVGLPGSPPDAGELKRQITIITDLEKNASVTVTIQGTAGQ